jgi:uncharacterized protein (TIGR02145 family)
MKKKMKLLLFPLILMGFILAFTNSCKKNDDNNPSNAITDPDGNVYHAVKIGTQTWMVENLKTTKYKDSTNIPLVADNLAWSTLTTEGYCWYNNDASTYKNPYGALYNWYAVNTGKLCPTGWHVPTDAEWSTLTTYLGGESVAGGKLKESGTNHWVTPNTDADNSYGFTALPGGSHYYNGAFYLNSKYGWYWSSTESSSADAWHVYMIYNSAANTRTSGAKNVGFSVRCLKDN